MDEFLSKYEAQMFAKQFNNVMNYARENGDFTYHNYYPQGPLKGEEWLVYKATAEGTTVYFTAFPGQGTSVKCGQRVKELPIGQEALREEIRAIAEQWAETGEDIEAWMLYR